MVVDVAIAAAIVDDGAVIGRAAFSSVQIPAISGFVFRYIRSPLRKDGVTILVHAVPTQKRENLFSYHKEG